MDTGIPVSVIVVTLTSGSLINSSGAGWLEIYNLGYNTTLTLVPAKNYSELYKNAHLKSIYSVSSYKFTSSANSLCNNIALTVLAD